MATLNYDVVTSNATLSWDYDIYFVDASGGSITLTLPDPFDYDGTHFYIKRVDTTYSNTVTVTPTNSHIDNLTTLSINSLQKFHFIAYNSNMYLL